MSRSNLGLRQLQYRKADAVERLLGFETHVTGEAWVDHHTDDYMGDSISIHVLWLVVVKEK